MKIAIYICGQIASGKTSVSEKLSSRLNLPLFKIDEVRKDYDTDKDVWSNIITKLKTTEGYIFESTGLSKRMERIIMNDIQLKRNFFVVKLVCSKETALMRVKSRKDTFTKWEYPFTLEESIEWVDKELKNLDADLEINTDKTLIDDVVESILERLKIFN